MRTASLFLILSFACIISASASSEEEKLKALKPEAERKIRKLLTIAREQFPEHTIILAETYRTQKRQDKLFAKGKNTTSVRVSMHTKRLAADIYFIKNGRIQSYEKAPYLRLGEIGESLGLTWGGRWKRPFDPAHFELRR